MRFVGSCDGPTLLSQCSGNSTPPPPCTSTALSKHVGPSGRRFSDRSFRFPLMGPSLSKHGTRPTVVFVTFSVLAQGVGRVLLGANNLHQLVNFWGIGGRWS